MKVEVKKIDATKRELKFEIPKERVKEKLNEVYEELGKVVKVKGFRQGKIPRPILESQHRKTAQEEAMRKLIPEVYQEGLKKENIIPIDLPEIQDVSFKDGIVTFLARFDIKPEIKIKDYKGINIKRKNSRVTEEEINKTLDFFKKGQGQDQGISIDDTFARGLGYPNLDEFKRSLTRQLELDKDRQNRIDVENQIITELLQRTKFTVPSSLVQKQLERRIAEQKQKLMSQGILEEEIKKRGDEMRKQLHDSIEKDVKVYLILDKIAELEKIEIKEGENLAMKVMEFLLKEAAWTQ